MVAVVGAPYALVVEVCGSLCGWSVQASASVWAVRGGKYATISQVCEPRLRRGLSTAVGGRRGCARRTFFSWSMTRGS